MTGETLAETKTGASIPVKVYQAEKIRVGLDGTVIDAATGKPAQVVDVRAIPVRVAHDDGTTSTILT